MGIKLLEAMIPGCCMMKSSNWKILSFILVISKFNLVNGHYTGAYTLEVPPSYSSIFFSFNSCVLETRMC